MVIPYFTHAEQRIDILLRFVDGELNACYNAVDRHVEAGMGSKIALIHDSPLTKTVRKVTYAELLDTASFSESL